MKIKTIKNRYSSEAIARSLILALRAKEKDPKVVKHMSKIVVKH